jgi:arabinofuranosyltransferase
MTRPSERAPSRRAVRAASAAAWLAAVALLLLNAKHYYPFIADDAFISLRYAERLIEGRGLTWTDGPPVEGYSNLLWILLCAALGWLGVDLVFAARMLGVLSIAVVLAAILRAVAPATLTHAAAAFVGMAAFAVAGPAGVWSIGGLEQPLVVALLSWALVVASPLLGREPVSRRAYLLPGALLALLTLSRADGAILVAGLCLGVAVVHGTRRTGWERGVFLGLLPLGAWLGQLGFRLHYYDSWVPNTARAKVAFTSERVVHGWDYVAGAAVSSALILALAVMLVAGTARQRTLRWRLASAACVVATVWGTYLVAIGGDIFPAYRHWLPILAMACLAAAVGLRVVLDRSARVGRPLLVVAATAVALYGARQPHDGMNHRGVTERWEFDGEVVGRLLHQAFLDRQPLLAAGAIGALCYHAKLPCLDMFGLNDRYLAENPPADFGTGHLGHELGDGSYALSREPDLVVFCGPTGGTTPCARGEREMIALPEFDQLYQLVRFRGTVPFEQSALIWVRRAGAVGIRESERGTVVPGHLLATADGLSAELDPSGRMGIRLADGHAARTTVSLPAGAWRLRVDSDMPQLVATRLSAPGLELHGGAILRFELETDAPHIGVHLMAGGESHVRQLVFERVPAPTRAPTPE